ncbi:MAG: glycoside hydrolase family 43 protein [Clostridiales bacterium]|nr:glycoside hydrolase family 43 protein [Clostridiales bacterium]
MRTLTNITQIGDPFVLYDGGMYYMYATHSGEGICVWRGSSPEKVESVGLCYFKKDSFGDGCFWAPEVVKRADGKYVMHFTARDRRDGVLRTGAAVSDSPLGPFKDVRPGKPMFDIGKATIDATCFIDDDGEGYLFYALDCSVNVINGVHTSQIYGVKLSESLTEVVGEHVLISTPTQGWETNELLAPCLSLLDNPEFKDGKTRFLWNEGPYVLKHNGKYYMTYSANCYDCPDYSVGYAVADKPLGEYKKYEGNPIMSKVEGELSGPGHNAFFKDKDGKLICAFHCHTHYDKPSGDRRYCLCPAEFDENGVLKLLYK